MITSPREAEKVFLRLKRWVIQERPPRDPQGAPEPFLAALLEDYVQLHMLVRGRRCRGKEEYRIGAIRRQFGALRASEIDTVRVEKWVFALRKRGLAPATVRRYVARLRCDSQLGRDSRPIGQVRVVRKALDLPAESRGRNRRFLLEEERGLRRGRRSRCRTSSRWRSIPVSDAER